MRNQCFAAAWRRICLGFACTAAAACSPADEATHSTAQPEVWSAEDNPSHFASRLERRASALPTSGEAEPVPWPGSYWPTSEDSINHRWNGPRSQSPAEKYELAFGRTGVQDAVSRHHGVDSLRHHEECGPGRRCKAGEACAKRRGATSGRCVPTWYGICEGWAAAALLFPEPRRKVVHNGVTFEVQDIKALVSLLYTAVDYRDISSRCDHEDERGGIEYDDHGRPQPECRDTNPGTFHVLLTNLVGLRKGSFVMDRTFHSEVWNQPIRGYSIKEQETVTPEEAMSLVTGRRRGAPPQITYAFNPDAVSLLHVKNEVSYVAESTSDVDGALLPSIRAYTKVARYQYVLELDGDGRIIGGEWAGRSRREHPDFLWRPLRARPAAVAGGTISYDDVKTLLDASITP